VVAGVPGSVPPNAYDGPTVEATVDPAALQTALAAWYAGNGRSLSFRRTRDPWAVLVSEVMLQQTQVSRVEPAWARFMELFPTPAALAAATPADALRAWAGLGYNRRGLNLWRAAQAIVQRHTGAVPSSIDDLRALPGVGDYTARAVAAIAFGVQTAAVDVNVRRVVTRLCWGGSLAPAPRELQQRADGLVDAAGPDAWTHAVMDIGATLCRVRNPACGECPLAAWCQFAGEGRTPAAASASSSLAEAAASDGATARAVAVPFPRTTRWLRGRIVEKLRVAPAGEWVRVDGPLGEHDPASVLAAVDVLAREGLLERASDGGVRLPSNGT
jgi:A/G-specific adenine glycosylase